MRAFHFASRQLELDRRRRPAPPTLAARRTLHQRAQRNGHADSRTTKLYDRRGQKRCCSKTRSASGISERFLDLNRFTKAHEQF